MVSVTNLSNRAFLAELNSLLRRSGITPIRLPITASAQNRGGSEEEGRGSDARQKVGAVILYIEENLAEPMSLEQLGARVELSKYQLIRRFRKVTGRTPWQYIREKRIDRAKRLLEDGFAPGQVAAETGFFDQSHLTHAFREETGKTPREYQQKNFRNRN